MYYLEIKHLEHLSIAQFEKKIGAARGIRLSTIKLSQLILANGKLIYPGIGVYVFKIGEEIVYVGKVSSRSFIERIPSHFDLRQKAWMNSFLKYYAIQKLSLRVNNRNLGKAAKKCFDDRVRLILIGFGSRSKKSISNFESHLRKILQPKYNRTKNKDYSQYEVRDLFRKLHFK